MKTAKHQFYKQNTFYVVMERHIPSKKTNLNWTPWKPAEGIIEINFEKARDFALDLVDYIIVDSGYKAANIAILSVTASGNRCVWIKSAKQPKK